MLVSFAVENFLSFKKRQEISFIANEKYLNKQRLYKSDEIDLLKTITIFGPNGSGKTNLILALYYCFKLFRAEDFMIDFFLQRSDEFRVIEIKNTCDQKNPVAFFEFVFTFFNKFYRYSFKFDVEKIKTVSETLEEINDEDHIIFNRIGNSLMFLGERIETDSLSNFDSRLLISYKESNLSENFQDLITFLDYNFRGIILGTYDFVNQKLDYYFNDNNSASTFSCNELYIEDLEKDLSDLTNLTKIIKKEIKNEDDGKGSFFVKDDLYYYGKTSYEIKFLERGFARERSFSELSSGTQRIILLLILTYSSKTLNDFDKKRYNFKNEKTPGKCRLLVIDEMCFSLHPKITNKLYNKLNEIQSKDGDPLQIIITAHSTELMNSTGLYPDQIYLIEKNDGASEIFSIDDMKGFEYYYSENLRLQKEGFLKKEYLEGRFGAVPKINVPRDLQ